jgi:hypothetical protein
MTSKSWNRLEFGLKTLALTCVLPPLLFTVAIEAAYQGTEMNGRNENSVKFDKVEFLNIKGSSVVLISDKKERRAHFTMVHGGPFGELYIEDRITKKQTPIKSSELVKAAQKAHPGYKVSANPCFPLAAKIMNHDLQIIGGNGFWFQRARTEENEKSFLDYDHQELIHEVYGSKYNQKGWEIWGFTLLILSLFGIPRYRKMWRRCKQSLLPTHHYVVILFGTSKGCGRAPEVLEVLNSINKYESAYSYSSEYIQERIGPHCSEFTPPLGIYRISTKGVSVKQSESSHYVWGDIMFKGILREI